MNLVNQTGERNRAFSIEEFLVGVEASIQDSFFAEAAIDANDLIHKAYLHHFAAKGGGSRARLTANCGIILRLSNKTATCLAAAIECLHNASLVQDDLQDSSRDRRGQKSVVAKFGPDVALGLTNRLVTTAFVCLSKIDQSWMLPSLINCLNKAVVETVGGQTLELANGEKELSFETRILAARKKSGPLFALALELPLILASKENYLDTAHEAASLFGLGYQIFDDLKDQQADLDSGSNGNLVLAMRSRYSEKDLNQAAICLALSYLEKAQKNAEALPNEVGQPLILLIRRLSSKIDAFSQ